MENYSMVTLHNQNSLNIGYMQNIFAILCLGVQINMQTNLAFANIFCAPLSRLLQILAYLSR